MLTRWEKAYRIAVYVGLWLTFFIPAEIRRRRGERIPPWLHVLLIVSGLMLSLTIAAQCHR